MKQTIRYMAEQDIDRAHDILESHSLTKLMEKVYTSDQSESGLLRAHGQNLRGGFFVQTKSKEELVTYCSGQNKRGYVLETEEGVAAILLTQGIKEWRDEILGKDGKMGESNCFRIDLGDGGLETIRIISNPTTVDYSYIAKDKTMPCDVRLLTRRFLEDAFQGSCIETGPAKYVIGRIWAMPFPNSLSQAYHQKFGFKDIALLHHSFNNIKGIEHLYFTSALMALSSEEFLARKARGKSR